MRRRDAPPLKLSDAPGRLSTSTLNDRERAEEEPERNPTQRPVAGA